MHFDVGYFADAMVCCRTHDMSMTNNITWRETIANRAYADVGILSIIRKRAQGAGFKTLAQNCLIAIANEYAKQGASKRYRSASFRMSRSEFELSLRWSTESESERQFIRARYLEGESVPDEAPVRRERNAY
jgi:hypothetical protein